MLNTTEESLLLEVRNAFDYSQRFVATYERLRKAMHGPRWKSGDGGDGSTVEYMPINVVNEWMSRVRPRITFRDPWWRGRSKRSGPFQLVAKSLGHAMNRWTKDTQMRKLNRRLCADFGLSFFAARVYQREDESELWREFDDPVVTPYVERISPRCFFWDPLAKSPEECRFYGHFWVKDLEDLIKEAEDNPDSWNVGVVQNLTPGGGRDFIGRQDENEIDRAEVVGCSMWIPELRPDDDLGPEDGFHGALVDFAMSAQTEKSDGNAEGCIIRPLRSFYGPRWGPYVWCGADIVPDETGYLSPITAAATQIDDLNRIAKREIINAAGYRRLILVNDTRDDLSEIIKDEPDRSVLPVSGIKREDINEVEVLGNSQQGMAQLMFSREIVDDALGMDSAQRGQVSGTGTATEVAEAAQESNARVDDMASAFASGVRQLGMTVSWYLYHDDRVVMPLDDEVAQQVGMEAPWYFGGDDRDPAVRRRLSKRLQALGIVPPEQWALYGGSHDPSSGATFDDIELELDPKDMERVDPRMRSQEIITGLGQFAAMVSQSAAAPWVDYESYAELIGEAYNMPDLADLWDEELYAKFVAQGQQAQRGPRQFGMLASMAGKAGKAQSAGGQQQGQQQPFGGGRGGAPAQPGGRQGAGAQAMRMQPAATPKGQ